LPFLGPAASGHNASPRGKVEFDSHGEPVYSERDHVDLAKMRDLGLPFWLAGGYGSPEMSRDRKGAVAGLRILTL
jgi:NAD(P)H-dependent flavin oxidoreductase YrpB (nitropropane dioxygenase family)